MSRRLAIPLVGLMVVVALPLFAQAIVLQSGERIAVRDVRWDPELQRLVLTFPNRTLHLLALDEVDIERTREENERGFGDALVLQMPEVDIVPPSEAREDLGRLIEERGLQPEPPPIVRREVLEYPGGRSPRELGGIDLYALERQPLSDTGLGAELRGHFTDQGLDAHVYRGSDSRRALVQVRTRTESAVFKSLVTGARALSRLSERHPGRVEALELLLETSPGDMVGQFLMTTTLAARLEAGELDAPTFFLRYVRF